LKELHTAYQLKRLKRKADKLSKRNREQYFIIKLDGKIDIISKSWFTNNRQHGVFPLDFTAEKLKEIALYYTK